MSTRDVDIPACGTVPHVIPFSAKGHGRPMAPWITTTGWALAAQRRYGQALILAPDGVHDPAAGVEASTSSIHESVKPHPARRVLPSTLSNMAKDVREAVRMTQFSNRVSSFETDDHVPFVWQRLHPFLDGGNRLAERLDRPLVLSVHALTARDRRTGQLVPAPWADLVELIGESRQIRRAHLLACVSEELSQQLVEMGLPSSRVILTPNGVDSQRFTPYGDDKLRATLCLTDRYVIGWSGSFRGFHALDQLLRAYAIVQRSIPEALLLLVGGGQELPGVKRQVAESRLSGVVFCGAVPASEMPDFIRTMDVGVVMAERGQQFHYSPVKLREYLACGRPAVAPSLGEPGRMREAGVLCVPPGDAAALADALIELGRDVNRRTELGAAGRAWAETNASWDTNVASVEARLRSLSLW